MLKLTYKSCGGWKKEEVCNYGWSTPSQISNIESVKEEVLTCLLSGVVLRFSQRRGGSSLTDEQVRPEISRWSKQAQPAFAHLLRSA